MGKFINEWRRIDKKPCFEIEVKDKYNDIEHILFDIYIEKDIVMGLTFVAQHINLSEDQEQVDLISMEIDTDLSIDENLEDLYVECADAITDGDLFELSFKL